MSEDLIFEEVDRITIGAIGAPGERTFFLQVNASGRTATLHIEKQHAISLAETTAHLLTQIGPSEPTASWTPEEMALDEGDQPLWNVGEMAIGYEEEKDRVVLVCNEIAATPEESGASAHFWLTRVQASALASYALIVASQGRPPCPFCKLPMNPEGHDCPAVNGHRNIDSISWPRE